MGAFVAPRKIELIREGNSRYYAVEGVEGKLPTVTGILGVIDKPWLAAWEKNMALDSLVESIRGRVLLDEELPEAVKQAKKAATVYRDKAGKFGTVLHELARAYADHEEIPIPESHSTVFVNLVTVARNLHIVNTEFPVYSLTDRYAGTVDAIALDPGGKVTLIDYKTSSRMAPEYAMQLAAYARAFQEMFPEVPPPSACCVRLEKEMYGAEVKYVLDVAASYEGFLAAKRLKESLSKPQWEAGAVC